MMIAVRIARACVDWIAALIGALDRFGKTAPRQRLVGEGLQGPHRADQFGRIGRGVGQRVLGRARAAPHRAAEADERQHDQRNGGEHETRELRAGDHHHGGGAEKQHDIAERDRHRGADRRLDLRGVGGEPRGQLAGPRGVEERRRERYQVAEHRRAEVRHHALAERRHEVVARCARQREHGDHRDHHAEILVDQPDVPGVEAEVDHPPHGDRHHQRGDRGDQQRHERRCGPAAVAHHIGNQELERAELGLAGGRPAARPAPRTVRAKALRCRRYRSCPCPVPDFGRARPLLCPRREGNCNKACPARSCRARPRPV